MNHDMEVLRELAKQYAEIANLPQQEAKRALWRRLNAKQDTRPMVMIDQVCWNEMNVNDELTVVCQDQEMRAYEDFLRKKLYQWRHFACDMVVESYIPVYKAIHGITLGMGVQEDTAITDSTNSVISHLYKNQFQTEADLEMIKMPTITHDVQETNRRMSIAHDVFDGVIGIKAMGADPYLSIWDPISMWMGPEALLYGIADRPEYMHALTNRVTDAYMTMLDQLEEQGLLCQPQPLIHCTGAYTDELPKPGYNPEKPRLQDLWMFALAQIFSTVSPACFEEFEVNYVNRLCERFGLVYYGCCDPLDRKMAQVRKIKNVRKVSVSPWCDQELAGREIHGDYVFSRKPNPAYLAGGWQPDLVKADILETMRIAKDNNCQLELILKDISTVRYEPQRLWEWNKIAMDLVENA